MHSGTGLFCCCRTENLEIKEIAMRRKLMMTAALVSAAFLALPSAGSHAAGMDEMSAQAGTKGVGAVRSGVGPGTNAGDPGLSSATGPGANPVTPGANPADRPAMSKKHVKRKHRSTVGSH